MGVIEGNAPASDNDWEAVKKGGDAAIQKWIDGQLDGKSCVVVLIGTNTAGRKWIKYEIETGWNNGKGVFGVYIHGLKDLDGKQSQMGANPFDDFTLKRDAAKLSWIVKAYVPPYLDSKQVYAYIEENLAAWMEEAIKIRAEY